MKKGQKAEEEFISQASPEELAAYVKANALTSLGEKALVERGLNDITRLYAKTHGLGMSAVHAIFVKNILSLITTAFECAHDKELAAREFLDYGEYKSVMGLIRMPDIRKHYPERGIIELNATQKMNELLSGPKISRFGVYDIIMRGHHNHIMALIDKGWLELREKRALAAFGRSNEILYMAENEPNERRREIYLMMWLIRFGTENEVLNLIAVNRLALEVEEFFFKFGAKHLVKAYHEKHELKVPASVAISRCCSAVRLRFLSENFLSEREEAGLIKRGIREEIRAYVKTKPLNFDSELLFIKRGVHTEIMYYLSRHSVSNVAQVELIYRGDGKEILSLVSKYPLCDEAGDALMKYGNDEAVDAWMARAASERNG